MRLFGYLLCVFFLIASFHQLLMGSSRADLSGARAPFAEPLQNSSDAKAMLLTAARQVVGGATASGFELHAELLNKSGTCIVKVRNGGEIRILITTVGGEQLEEIYFPGTPPHIRLRKGTAEWREGALHNSFISGAWLFPAAALNEAAVNPEIQAKIVGSETYGGRQATHLRLWREVAGQNDTAVAMIRRVSQVELYLDSITNLPIAVRYATHPENDSETTLMVEYRFTEYSNVSGVSIPFSIERRLNGSPNLLMRLTSAQPAQLTESDFEGGN